MRLKNDILQTKRRHWRFARPSLRRFVVLALVPAAISFYAWRTYVPMLRKAGAPWLAMTIAPLWIWRIIALVTLNVLLAAVAVHTVTRRPRPSEGRATQSRVVHAVERPSG